MYFARFLEGKWVCKIDMASSSEPQTIADCLQMHVVDSITTSTTTSPPEPPRDSEENIILHCNQTLKLQIAIAILNNTHHYKEKLINSVPENPNGGDTFLLIPRPGDEGEFVF